MYRFSLAHLFDQQPVTSDKEQHLEDIVIESATASLYKDLNKRVLLTLTDNRLIIGTLSTIDPFLNCVLVDAFERIIIENVYADVHIGFGLFRGTDIASIGSLETEEVPEALEEVEESVVRGLFAEKRKRDKQIGRLIKAAFIDDDFLI
ncbi:hypothetical protein P9112_013861 [Eukaryota sp. TZLM1-RC]